MEDIAGSVSARPDAFADLASKLRLLLGRQHATRVLLVGDLYSADVTSFRRAFETVSLESPHVSRQEGISRDFDLICYDSRSTPKSLAIDAACESFSKRLRPGGTLVVALDDLDLQAKLLGRIGRNSAPYSVPHRLTDARRGIQNAGLRTDEFLALPSLDEPDEFVRSSIAAGEMRPSMRRRLGSRMGLVGALHTQFLLLASDNTRGSIGELTSVVERTLNLDRGLLQVDRFAMRRRGSLIALMIDAGRSHPVVVRIAATKEIGVVLGRNAECVDRLASSDLPACMKALIPRTLSRFTYGEAFGFVEERLPGILAWKLKIDSSIEERITSHAVAFLCALDAATRRTATLLDADFHVLVGAALQSLRSIFSHERGVLASLNSIEHRLRSRLIGNLVPIVHGHGDFGHGNLLCAPDSGELLGVIDWDTFIENEIPGVDVCNFLLQRHATVAGCGVATAFAELHSRIGHIPVVAKFPLADDDAARWTLPLTVAAVRYVHRSARYMSEFVAMRESHIRLLEAAAVNYHN